MNLQALYFLIEEEQEKSEKYKVQCNRLGDRYESILDGNEHDRINILHEIYDITFSLFGYYSKKASELKEMWVSLRDSPNPPPLKGFLYKIRQKKENLQKSIQLLNNQLDSGLESFYGFTMGFDEEDNFYEEY